MSSSLSSEDDYDSEEERAAGRRAALGGAQAAAAARRAQADLLHAYRERQAAKEALERGALRAKLQQQCGLGGGAEQRAWDDGDDEGWGAGGSAGADLLRGPRRMQAWLRALQQHEGRWAALEAAAEASSSGSTRGGDGDTAGSSSSSASVGGTLGHADVPWPPLEPADYLRALAAWEQQQQQQQQQQQAPPASRHQRQQRAARRAYARACLRWHPDKFEGRWGGVLAPADRQRVLDQVHALAQGINQAWTELQAELAGEGDGDTGGWE